MTDTPSVGTTKAEVRRARRAVLKARLIQILWGTDLLATRVVVGVASLLWALALLSSRELFPTPLQVSVGTGAMEYAVMSLVASEWQWGQVLLLHGVGAILAVLFDIRSRLLMLTEGILGCLLWTVICASVCASVARDFSHTLPAVTGPNLVIGLCAWWVLVRYQAGGSSGN